MLPTPEQSTGIAGAIISVFSALGSWVVLVLVALIGVLVVLHKHGIAWLGEWITGKAKMQGLAEHAQRCDKELAQLKLESAAQNARHLATEARHTADLADLRAEIGKRNDTIDTLHTTVEGLFMLAKDLREKFGGDRREMAMPVENERREKPHGLNLPPPA